MSLKDTFRKAAEIFVEMPDEEAGAHASHAVHPDQSAPPDHAPTATAVPAPDAGEDIDKRLADMSKRLAGMQANPLAPEPPHTLETTPEREIPKTLEMSEEDVARLTVAKSAAPEAAVAPDTRNTPDTSAPVTSADGKLDVGALYARANIPATPFTAEQALDMIHSLPANLPDDVKRQTVQVTIASMGKAIGASSETIVADAARKRAALSAYANEVAEHATAFSQAAEFEIAEMERQIEEKRAAIRATQDRQMQLKTLCDVEAAHLSELLTFLGDGDSPVQ